MKKQNVTLATDNRKDALELLKKDGTLLKVKTGLRAGLKATPVLF